jgi:signal transduction histidine kinase
MQIDSNARISFINAASVLFFNKPPELLIGRDLESVIIEEGLTPLDINIVRGVIQNRQAEIIEGQIISNQGMLKNIEIRVIPEPFGLSKESHLVLLIRDNTLRKEAERKMLLAIQKAQESDSLKSAFLANMSHEIRTPLNAIVGFSQIIVDKNIDQEEQERFFQYIQENSNQLINLVNDIIDLSKLESNQLVIRESMTELNQLMYELKVMAEHEKKTREKDHILVFMETDLLDNNGLIYIDQYRLKQILTNLLVNAIKFTPKGYIHFGYRLKDNDTLLFFIRDTGIGIPKNKQKEIFQYFHQLENTLNRSNSGTGLGLAICKKLVELMNGTIWLQSDPGKGTSFFMTLPYHTALPNS